MLTACSTANELENEWALNADSFIVSNTGHVLQTGKQLLTDRGIKSVIHRECARPFSPTQEEKERSNLVK
jgi:hypothetical protein